MNVIKNTKYDFLDLNPLNSEEIETYWKKTICLDQYGIIVWFVFLWADLLFFSITPQNNLLPDKIHN